MNTDIAFDVIFLTNPIEEDLLREIMAAKVGGSSKGKKLEVSDGSGNNNCSLKSPKSPTQTSLMPWRAWKSSMKIFEMS